MLLEPLTLIVPMDAYLRRSLGVLMMVVLAPALCPAASLVGLWKFDNPNNLSQASVGSDLTMSNSKGTIVAREGISSGDGAAEVGVGDYFAAAPGIAANGGSSAYVNEYTLVYDIYLPASSDSTWRSLLQTAPHVGDNDGDYFINSDNRVGVASINYSSQTLSSGQWIRIIFSADIGISPSFTTTVITQSGQSWQYDHGAESLNGRHSLYPASGNNVVYFFADENGEDHLLYVTQLAVYDGTMDAAAALSLGAPGSDLENINASPVIAEGTSEAILAQVNDPAQSYTLHASDSDGDPLVWSVQAQPAHGSIAIVSHSGGVVTFNYTPEANYTGIDSFSLAVTDGTSSATYSYSVLVSDPNVSAYEDPVGLWEFNYPSDITLSTIGYDLGLSGSDISTGEGSVTLGAGTYFVMTHGIPAGKSGGSLVNTYTLLFDIRYPSSSPWKTLFQCNPENTDDGDLFIRPDSGTVGTAAGLDGYSSSGTSAGTWYRVVMTVDNGTARKVYVNGALWNAGIAGSLDDRYGLVDQLLIFADNDGEDGAIEVTNLAIWDYALDAVAVAELGSADAFIVDAPEPTPNDPPIITEGDTADLDLTMNSGAHALTFNATDGDGDVLAWSLSSEPANGSVVISVGTGSQVKLSYTPNENFIGTDSFILRAADEKVYDEITVSVTVSNEAPVLSEGDSYALNATMNMEEQGFTLHAHDGDGNMLIWSVGTDPKHGSVKIEEGQDGEALVSYTPESGYTGLDSFVVTVSDGLESTSITVTVSVSDPNADPILTVVDAYGTSDPAAGDYTYSAGTQITLTASSQGSATIRATPVGWTMIGGNVTSGEGATATIELNRNSVFTWQYKTEYKLDFEAGSGGSVSLPDGWYEGGKPLQLTAIADEGYYFAGWSGDIDDAISGGKALVLPMGRAYGTIIANFEREEPFTVVALPDTQNYTSIGSPTDIFEQQTQWVLDNQVTMNIQFLTHLGDVVNSPSSSSQWLRATTAMDLLNDKLPYGLCPGNHDVNSSRSNTDYLQRFGPSAERWYNPADGNYYDWYRGASPTGYSSYQIITVDGREWMFLHIDIDVTDQDIAWAQGVLDAHPTTLTMLTTHNYLAETGGGGSSGTGTGERGRVPVLWFGGSNRNTPEQLFQKLVKPNNQIYMVICGHNFAIYNLEQINDAGNVVHELLVDYQTLPNGGNGFLRIMEFTPSTGKIANSTYSPYLGRYINPDNSSDAQGMADLHDKYGGEFEITVDFDGRFNHTLTVVSNSADVVPAVGDHSLADGTPLVIEATDKTTGTTRQHVKGWTLNGAKQNLSGDGNIATVMMAGDATLTWEYGTQYYLQTQAVGDGIVSVASGWQNDQAVVEIQAQPDAGASFIGWSGDIDGAVINGRTLTLTVDRARGPVTAEFTSSTQVHYVQVISDQNSVSPAAATYTYEAGSAVTFTASTRVDGDTRYVPLGYSYTLGGGDAVTGSDSSIELNVTGDLAFTWLWGTQYRLDISTSGPGTLSPDTGWVDSGSALTVTAVPNAHATFTGWGGDTSGLTVNGAQIEIASMDAPIGPLTATFATQRFALMVESPDGSPGSTPTTQSYDYGSTVSVTAQPESYGRTRRVATDWSVSGATQGSGTGNEASFTLTGDTTLSWNWETQVLLELSSGSQGVILRSKPPAGTPWGRTLRWKRSRGSGFPLFSGKATCPTMLTPPRRA